MSCTSAADQMCTSVMHGNPVAMCTGGKWGPCACVGATTGATTAAGSGSTTTGAPANCGNGKAEGDEQCDGSDLKGMNCMSLGMGAATAVLKCNSRCAFDTLMCFAAGGKANGGTGAGGTGTGTKTTGSAGSGGSGR